MSSNLFENIGQSLARLPINITRINIYDPDIPEGKQNALKEALASSITELIHACPDDEEACMYFGDCISGFAKELVRIIFAAREEQERSAETMHVDGHDWELVFDPGPKSRNLLTDDKGRVWRRIGQDDDDCRFLF